MYDPLLIILISIVIIQNALLLSRRRIINRGERSILVDTSVLIDGRILEIADARFIPGRLLIPRSVLGELQLLADGSDHEKRLRARNGLELITKLQAVPRLTVEIYQDAAQAPEGVDDRLLALASKNGFEICTVDYNLQMVADAQGIKTLSINELSRNLKALYLPGERLELPLSQKGQEKNQAIGYASDGTMVVVDGADGKIGQTVTVEIIRSLQTNSGKMMFARMVRDDAGTQGGRRDSGPRSAGRDEGRGGLPKRGGRMFRRPRADDTIQPTQQAPEAATLPTSENEQSIDQTSRQSNRQNRTPRIRNSSVERTDVNETNSVTTTTTAAPRSSGRGRRGKSSPEDDLLNLVNKL